MNEFGDVYTNIYALQGDGFFVCAVCMTMRSGFRTELLRVPNLNKVDFQSRTQEQRVYVEIRMAQLGEAPGLTPQQIADAVNLPETR